MGELVFFVAILIFTILEAVAKSRRQRGEGAEDGGAQTPEEVAAEIERRRQEARRRRAEARRAQQQRERAQADQGSPRQGGGRAGAPARPEPVGPAGRSGSAAGEEPSTTMLPADLWEEIADLMAGRRRPEPPPEESLGWESEEWDEIERRPVRRGGAAPTVPEPRPAAPSPSRASTRVASAAERRDAPHRVHRSHPEFGVDPSERAPSRFPAFEQEEGSVHTASVRALLLGSQGADALKQAIVLQEILGPPAALRKPD